MNVCLFQPKKPQLKLDQMLGKLLSRQRRSDDRQTFTIIAIIMLCNESVSYCFSLLMLFSFIIPLSKHHCFVQFGATRA